MGKTAVIGLLERHGPDKPSRVRVKVVPGTRKKVLQDEVRQRVEPGSALYTDALKSYEGLAPDYAHQVIDHAESYVRGKVHTNGLENFWRLVKRAIKGTYVSVEPFHLFRYLDEEVFRFNERGDNDGGRFVKVLRSVLGKRLTFAQLRSSPQRSGECGFRRRHPSCPERVVPRASGVDVLDGSVAPRDVHERVGEQGRGPHQIEW